MTELRHGDLRDPNNLSWSEMPRGWFLVVGRIHSQMPTHAILVRTDVPMERLW